MNLGVILIPDSLPQFERFYVCLEACNRGFTAGCKLLIKLDDAFLKGYYGGQILSVVGKDANKHIFVIAFAIVNVENKDNWMWFLNLLLLPSGLKNLRGGVN